MCTVAFLMIGRHNLFGDIGKTQIETYAEMPTLNKEVDKLEKHVSEK